MLWGGANSSGTEYNDVQFAPINSGGDIGAWNYTHDSTNDGGTFVSGFTNTRTNHSSVVYNGYIYIVGGFDGNSVYYNDVQYAPINANGTIGTWVTDSGTSFTNARRSFGAAVYNGYLYIVGGSDGSNFSDVQYAAINSDASINTWSYTTSFSVNRSGHTTVAYNGYLYLIGGTHSTSDTACNGSASLNCSSTQYAPIAADGTIGTWATGTNFTTARGGHKSVAYNGYLYVIGGYDGTTYNNDTQYTPALTNAYKARYERTIDTSASGNIINSFTIMVQLSVATPLRIKQQVAVTSMVLLQHYSTSTQALAKQ